MKFNTEFTIICPYWRKSIGRLGSKFCIAFLPFIDSCKIFEEGWWQSARMEIIHKYCIMQVDDIIEFNYFKSHCS